MANVGANNGFKESSMEDDNKIDIEETCVNLDCVKNESNEEQLDFEKDNAIEYRITLKYENLFGKFTHHPIINKDYNNLIGFDGNDVIMENAMIKLEAIKEEDDWSFNNFVDCSKCKGIYKGYCLKCSTCEYSKGDIAVEEMKNDCDTNDKETKCFSGANYDIDLIDHLNNEVHNATETHNKDQVKNDLNNQGRIKRFQCDLCTMKFSQKVSLKAHLRNNHTDDGGAKDYKCSECSFQTNYKHSLQNHLNMHKGIKFECDICMKKFTRKSNLKKHVKDKHMGDENAKDYRCSKCSYQTNYQQRFQIHLKRHAGIKQFECGICKMKFVQKSNLNAHRKNKHEKDYKCSECLFQTNCKNALRNHLNWHRGIKPFECNNCKMKFVEKKQLKIHIKEKHGDSEDYECTYQTYNKSAAQKYKGAKDYKCPKCPYQTNIEHLLQRHVNKHRDINDYQCDICMRKFAEKDSVKRHIRDIHTKNGSGKDYKCSICPYQTNSKHNLQRHLNSHIGIKQFECDICMRKFTQKSNLGTHKKNKHAGNGKEKDHKCLECSYQTNHKHDLQRHIDMHRGIKPFECDNCKMIFSYKHHLKRHMKNKHAANGSEKDYKCSECSYQTNYKDHLQQHTNMHRGIKPFECDNCKMKFSQKNVLKTHMRNIHAANGTEKDYKCSECPYQTDYKYSFQNHLNSHRNIKQFEGDVCNMKLIQNTNLKSHINDAFRQLICKKL